MEEKTKQLEDQELVPQFGSGAMLSAARKQQKKSVEEIADELNLSLAQIRAIELDQSDGLPEPTYVRGYIRSYANLLGLNPEEVLAHYLNKNWQKSANLDDMPRGISESETTETSSFSPARVIVFLGIAGLIGFFWFSGGLENWFGNSNESAPEEFVADNSGGAQDTENSDQESLENGVQISASDVENNESASESIDLTSFESIVPEGQNNNGFPGSESTSASLSAEPESQEIQVVLTFTETSWVDIRDEEQNRLAYQSYPAGDTVNVSSKGLLSILIGNAKGVKMSLNGQDYDLSQHTEGVYAKFSVGTPQD